MDSERLSASHWHGPATTGIWILVIINAAAFLKGSLLKPTSVAAQAGSSVVRLQEYLSSDNEEWQHSRHLALPLFA